MKKNSPLIPTYVVLSCLFFLTISHQIFALTLADLKMMNREEIKSFSKSLFNDLTSASQDIEERASEYCDRFPNITGPRETRVMNFFNGNFVTLISGEKFIVTQYPLTGEGFAQKESRHVFFKAIEQHGNGIIINLFNLEDYSRYQISRYEEGIFGEYNVFELSTATSNENPFLIHQLQFKNEEKEDDAILVTELEYNQWKDFNTTGAETLLKLIQTYKIQKEKPIHMRPEKSTLIHCRAGVGRTGTFLATYDIFNLLSHTSAEEKAERDIVQLFKNVILNLRKQRGQLVVQTEEQLETIILFTTANF